MTAIGRCLAATAITLATCAAHAQLHARDINGDGSVDAFYDVQQDLTWLADANYAATSGYWNTLPHFPYAGLENEPGRMNQFESVTWADQLDFHGVTDWRLPLLLDPPTVDPSIGAPPETPCSQVSGWLCVVGPSEMTALFMQLDGGISPFLNLHRDAGYWTGSRFGLNDSHAAYVRANGTSGRTDELGVPTYAWAVRNGDVALAVPEPSTYALMAMGLAAISGVARRRRAA